LKISACLVYQDVILNFVKALVARKGNVTPGGVLILADGFTYQKVLIIRIYGNFEI
jgi:hypothetical protein